MITMHMYDKPYNYREKRFVLYSSGMHRSVAMVFLHVPGHISIQLKCSWLHNMLF